MLKVFGHVLHGLPVLADSNLWGPLLPGPVLGGSVLGSLLTAGGELADENVMLMLGLQMMGSMGAGAGAEAGDDGERSFLSYALLSSLERHTARTMIASGYM